MMDRRLIEGGMEEREQVCGADCGGRAGSTAAGDRRAKPEELTLADFPARFHFSNASEALRNAGKLAGYVTVPRISCIEKRSENQS
jgi:hypothetical protein